MTEKIKNLRGEAGVVFRPATKADIEFFAPGSTQTFKAIAFEQNGELAGVAGLKLNGGIFVAFMDMKEGLKPDKLTIWRCTKEVMKMIESTTKYCIAVMSIPSAEVFLKRLGFVILNAEEKVYVWRSSQQHFQ